MELSKKTTILFPPELHERLSAIAAQGDRMILVDANILMYAADFDRLPGIHRREPTPPASGQFTS